MTTDNNEPVRKNETVVRPEEDAALNEWNEILEDIPEFIRKPLIEYGKQIAAGIMIVLLAVVIVSGYSHYRQSQENEAATALAFAIANTDTVAKVDALKKVIQEHSGTDAADHAVILLAAAQRDNGNFAGAAANFKKAADIFGEDTLAGQSAVMGSGYVAEAEDRNEQAAKYYEDAIEASVGFEEIALSDKARVLAASGRISEAIGCYDKLIEMKPLGLDLDFIRYQVMQLSSKK